MKRTSTQIVDPSQLAATVETTRGLSFFVRPLVAEDAQALGIFLDGLTEATRGVYRPHPLDSDHAHILCSQLDPARCLRFVALGPDPDAAIVAASGSAASSSCKRADTSGQIRAYMILDLGVRDGEVQRYAEAGQSLDADTTATFAPVVGDAWQEKGLGSAMFPVLIAAARRLGRTQIVLMGGVRDDNPRARHFYTKCGFEWVRGFFNGIDNHDMILRL